MLLEFCWKGTDFYMTSLNAQTIIQEWNNGINIVDILEVLAPQASPSCSFDPKNEDDLRINGYETTFATNALTWPGDDTLERHSSDEQPAHAHAHPHA